MSSCLLLTMDIRTTQSHVCVYIYEITLCESMHGFTSRIDILGPCDYGSLQLLAGKIKHASGDNSRMGHPLEFNPALDITHLL